MCEIANVLKHLTGFLNKEASPKCLEANDSSPTKSSEVDQSCDYHQGREDTAMVPSSWLSSPHQTPYSNIHNQWSRSQLIKFQELSWRKGGGNSQDDYYWKHLDKDCGTMTLGGNP